MHWPHDLVQGPRGSPNDPWHIPSALRDPSDFARGPSVSPNGTWFIPSVGTGPSDPARGPSGLAKWSLAPTQRAHGP
ncbi:UNVERIFIED_CONTAM: hypothetical protein FKN15_036845 [Acipenser sinensis]